MAAGQTGGGLQPTVGALTPPEPPARPTLLIEGREKSARSQPLSAKERRP